jgi:hypothetical protein
VRRELPQKEAISWCVLHLLLSSRSQKSEIHRWQGHPVLRVQGRVIPSAKTLFANEAPGQGPSRRFQLMGLQVSLAWGPILQSLPPSSCGVSPLPVSPLLSLVRTLPLHLGPPSSSMAS